MNNKENNENLHMKTSGKDEIESVNRDLNKSPFSEPSQKENKEENIQYIEPEKYDYHNDALGNIARHIHANDDMKFKESVQEESKPIAGVFKPNKTPHLYSQKQLIASVLAVGLLGGLVGGSMNALLYKDSPEEQVINSTLEPTKTTPTKETSNLSATIQEVMPSMVAVTTTMTVTYENPFSMFGEKEKSAEETGSGSGIIIGKNDTELLVLTNEHVISDADSVQVVFIDNKTVKGKIKSSDKEADLAIIAIPLKSINEKTMKQIKVATIGNSDDLVLGEEVIAIGNSLGYGQTVTTGIVSAVNRNITDASGIERTFIQTDAAINPGNSGGALLNAKGEVIGINESKISSSGIEGVGFAIPITSANEIINTLMNKKTRDVVSEDEVGYLGISCTNITTQLSKQLNMPVGVYINEAVKDGGAAKSGLQSGDIITKFDGAKITNTNSLTSTLKYYKKGETIKVIIQRQENGTYKEKEVDVTLSSAKTFKDKN